MIAAFRWWAELRGLPMDIVDHIPFGRTSTDAAAVLAPHLDSVIEGRLLDDRQAEETTGVVAFPGAFELLSWHPQLAMVTSAPLRLAKPAQRRGSCRCHGIWHAGALAGGETRPEPYLKGAASPAALALGGRAGGCAVTLVPKWNERPSRDAGGAASVAVGIGA